jgi:hypothetical protein
MLPGELGAGRDLLRLASPCRCRRRGFGHRGTSDPQLKQLVFFLIFYIFYFYVLLEQNEKSLVISADSIDKFWPPPHWKLGKS